MTELILRNEGILGADGQMNTDKIRRPKSEGRKKSESRSPNALSQRLADIQTIRTDNHK
jgi:hypothetical protein